MTGEELYTVYGSVTGFKNFQGNPMPAWADLTTTIQAAWNAVAEAKNSKPELDAVEASIAQFALDYATHYQSVPIPGRNLILLLAKFAKALGLKNG